MPSVPVPVNVIWDVSVGFNTHFLLLPPPVVPPPVPTYAVEMIATQMWTAGYLLNKNKWAKKVTHKGVYIAQGDHDVGPLIPDVTIPPTNLWYPVIWPFSKREIKFSASSVVMQGNPAGCASLWPVLPMLSCGDPMAAPLTFPLTNVFINNVYVGLSLMDFIKGWANIAASMVIDYIFSLGGAPGKIGEEIMGKFIPSPKELLKSAVSGGAGFVIDLLTGPPGDAQFKFGVGNAWGGAQVNWSWNKGPGIEGHALGFQPDCQWTPPNNDGSHWGGSQGWGSSLF